MSGTKKIVAINIACYIIALLNFILSYLLYHSKYKNLSINLSTFFLVSGVVVIIASFIICSFYIATHDDDDNSNDYKGSEL